MPALRDVLGTWNLDWWALGFLLVAGGLYAWGLLRASRAGIRWPLWRIAAFYGVGLGIYAAVSFGFLGTYSPDLRWAFSIRIALLLFVVPAGLALGLPLALARVAVRQGRLRTVLAAIARKPVRLFSNSAVAPVLGLLVLPMVEEKNRISTALIMVQFVFAFIELLADAINSMTSRWVNSMPHTCTYTDSCLQWP